MYCGEANLNFFCKLILVAFIFVLPIRPAFAIHVNALYTSACKRNIGVILGFDNRDIHFLTLDGELKKIPPYNVIYWATYPIASFPLRGKVNLGTAYPIKITTKTDRFVPLVEGWPIGFTKEKIAFMTSNGLETIIDRRSIWKVEVQNQFSAVEFSGVGSSREMDFVHPYIFRDCPSNVKGAKFYPQQVLVDPITIKRELDQLRSGHVQVERYVREQTFYSVPQLYFNKTHLGIWHNLGSRYGSGGKRTNNFTPILTNDYSSDVFDYQHRFSSGSAPLSFLIHEESQTHVAYQFKASYFHLRAMIDPSYILVGSNYLWQEYSFPTVEDRINDGSVFELGFDYGNVSLQLYMLDQVHVGVRMVDRFVSQTLPIQRIGMRYENFWFFSEMSYGKGRGDFRDQASLELTALRLNLGTKYFAGYQVLYSLISRQFSANSTTDYKSSSLTNSVTLEKELGRRFTLFSQLSLEHFKKSFGPAGQLIDETNLYPKAAFGGSLSF